MQVDMHYYAVYYLSLAAGFDPEDAYKIAYSSQYVDDAREHQKISLVDEHGVKKILDPICTQHMSLQGFSEIAADKVFFPFHFVPKADIDDPIDKIITRPFDENSIHQKTFKKASSSGNFYRLGIALHALADSYSHQYFAGEWSFVNEIKPMRYVLRRRIMPVHFIKSIGIVIWSWIKRFGQWIYTYIAPAIGHVRAYKVPDYPHAVWRFKNYEGLQIKRSNPDSFIRAGMEMYKQLKQFNKTENSLKDELEVKEILQYIVYTTGLKKRRIKLWRKEILNVAQKKNIENKVKEFLHYDPKEWKQKAFKKNISHSKELKPRKNKPYKINGSFNDFKNSDYYQYLLAAKEQRIVILEALKKLLPRVKLSLKETKVKEILA